MCFVEDAGRLGYETVQIGARMRSHTHFQGSLVEQDNQQDFRITQKEAMFAIEKSNALDGKVNSP